VTYAYVQDIASSWDYYERIAAALVEPAPKGLIAHVAGPTDDGVRIIEIWDTEEAWERFRDERLAAAVAAIETPARPEPTFRALHAQQTHFRHGGESSG
jgi:hypothetical protein